MDVRDQWAKAFYRLCNSSAVIVHVGFYGRQSGKFSKFCRIWFELYVLLDDKSMGLRHIFYVIFIWPVSLLLRGVGSPFVALGQLLRWLFYSRRNSITSGTTPAYYDDGSSTADGDDNEIWRQGDGSFNQYGRQSSGDNVKYRNRLAPSSLKGLTSDDVHRGNTGGGPSASVNGDPQISSPVTKNLPTTFYAINVPPEALKGNGKFISWFVFYFIICSTCIYS